MSVSPRGAIKRGVELTLVRSGLASLRGRISGTNRVVLAFHNIVADTEPVRGDRSLHLPLSAFRRFLDALMESHRTVSLTNLLDGAGDPRERLAAITFDDAYRGTLTLGLEELAKRGLESTVFVCPGLLGSKGFWWDLLARGDTGVVPPTVRTKLFSNLGGRQVDALAWAEKEGLAQQDPPSWHCAPGTEEEVMEVGSRPGVTLASHTWSHPHLPSIAGDELERELRAPLEWFSERGLAAPPILSYPYGAASESVRSAAAGAGYAYGLLVSGGAFRQRELPQARLSVPRVNVPAGLSGEGFMGRILGAWGR